MQETEEEGNRSVFDKVSSSKSNTAVNVLDQHFSSSESEATNGIVTTATTITLIITERDIKEEEIK